MRELKFLIVILFVSSCASSVKQIRQYKDSWGRLSDGCQRQVDDSYICTKEALAEAYDNQVNCYYDLKACRIAANANSKTCKLKLELCEAELAVWWRNPFVLFGGGIVLGVGGGLILGAVVN